MAPRRNVRSVSRKDAPISPPKASSSSVAATSPDVSSQNKRATRASSRNFTAAQQQLQNIDQVLGPVEEEFDEHPSDGPADDHSPSSTGSHLQSELNELDRDAIINNLAILHDDATALLSLFEGFENDDRGLALFCEKLSTSNSPQHRRFQVREKRLLASREAYGDLDFIQSTLILRKIADTLELEALNHGPWRPDPVLYIANLALQIVAVFSTSSEDRHTYLQFMFNNFPTPFAGGRNFALGTTMIDETIDMSIDILTQFYIQTAMAEEVSPSFDPDILAGNIFWDEGDHARGLDHPNTLLKVIERVELLRKYFKAKPRKSIDLAALRERFSWSDFVHQVVKWSLARHEELQESINARGGIDTICDFLVAGDLTGRENPVAPSVETAEQERAKPIRRVALLEPAEVVTGSPQKLASGPPTGKSLKAMVSRLRDLKTEYAVRSSGAHTEVVVQDRPEQIQEIPPSPTPVETDEGEPADEAESPKQSKHLAKPQVQEDDLVMTQQTRIVMETIRRQQEQSEKENKHVTTKKRSLLDRQATAEKVKWSEATDDPTPPRKVAPRQTPALGDSDSDDDDDDDDDEEFETDDRAAKRPRVDVESSTGKSPSSRPRPSASSQPARSSVEQPRFRSTLQPIPAPRVPSSTAPADRRRQRSPVVSEVAQVNEEAKLQARLSREIMRRPEAQVRRPYTEGEIGRLMEMVELHGTKWSTVLEEDAIHEDGPLLQGRTQVQLKDKARNIKLDFLKARHRLPPGFEQVSIGNRQIELLRQLGITYIEEQPHDLGGRSG